MYLVLIEFHKLLYIYHADDFNHNNVFTRKLAGANRTMILIDLYLINL